MGNSFGKPWCNTLPNRAPSVAMRRCRSWVRLFGNCCENETGFNTPPNVFNDLAGQARGFYSRFHGNSQRAQKTTWFSTSHEQPPRLLALSPSLIVAAPNFLQNLWPGTLGIGSGVPLHEVFRAPILSIAVKKG